VKEVDAREGEHLVAPSCLAPQMIEQNICVVLSPKLVVCGWGDFRSVVDHAIINEQRVGFHEARRQIAQQLFLNFSNRDDFDYQAITRIFVFLQIFGFSLVIYITTALRNFKPKIGKLK